MVSDVRFVCVEHGHVVCIHKALSVFTTLSTAVLSSLHSGVVVMSWNVATFYLHHLHQTPWLVGTTVQTSTVLWTRSSLQTPSCSVVKLSSPALASWHKGTNNSRTPPYYGHTSSSQIPGLYHIQHIDRIEMVDDHDVKVARVSLGKG